MGPSFGPTVARFTVLPTPPVYYYDMYSSVHKASLVLGFFCVTLYVHSLVYQLFRGLESVPTHYTEYHSTYCTCKLSP